MNNADLLKYINIEGSYKHNGYEIKSAYTCAFHEARSLTGRDIKTGEIMDNNQTGIWSGALVYMVLIDIIGSTFRKKYFREKIKRRNTLFISALENFSPLSKQEIFALYALRCAFAHEFFLFNIPKHKDKDKKLLMHCFTVTRGTKKLLVLPKKRWSGRYKDLGGDVTTTVDLEELGNLVEKMHLNLKDLMVQNKIGIMKSKKRLSFNHMGYNI
jgi:hypothetical protein